MSKLIMTGIAVIAAVFFLDGMVEVINVGYEVYLATIMAIVLAPLVEPHF